MERIVYNKTLDVHKNGVQFTLQGFETADKLSRRLVISLMASGDAIDFPLEQIMALMYVNKSEEPYECEIKDNTIIYDVLPITEEGIAELQLKIIETRPEGAKSVLATPKFAIEVIKSNADDESVQQTTAFTALEDALARAKEVYDRRFSRMELSEDCMFRAFYEDGIIYETDVLKRLFNNGNVLLSQSYARGDSGVRQGEETDNSMYYSNVSKSAALESKGYKEDAQDVLADVQKHGLYTAFKVDFTTGEVEYVSPRYSFEVNKETGELDVIGKAYTFEGDVIDVTREWLEAQRVNVEEMVRAFNSNEQTLSEMKKTDDTQAQAISELEETTAEFREELNSLNAAAEWKTLGAFSCEYIGQNGKNDSKTLEFDLENSDIPKDCHECRYVIKAGSVFECRCNPNYSSTDAYLYLGYSDRYGAHCFDLEAHSTGEAVTKRVELEEDTVIYPGSLISRVEDGNLEYVIAWHRGETFLALNQVTLDTTCYSGSAVYCNFTMEVQVR